MPSERDPDAALAGQRPAGIGHRGVLRRPEQRDPEAWRQWKPPPAAYPTRGQSE